MMRDSIRLNSALLASNSAPADPIARRGDGAAIANALKGWTARNPSPFAPRPRRVNKPRDKK